jgi:hypothetical protein
MDLNSSGYDPVIGVCEYDDEILDYIKIGTFLRLDNWTISKEENGLWR